MSMEVSDLESQRGLLHGLGLPYEINEYLRDIAPKAGCNHDGEEALENLWHEHLHNGEHLRRRKLLELSTIGSNALALGEVILGA